MEGNHNLLFDDNYFKVSKVLSCVEAECYSLYVCIISHCKKFFITSQHELMCIPCSIAAFAMLWWVSLGVNTMTMSPGAGENVDMASRYADGSSTSLGGYVLHHRSMLE